MRLLIITKLNRHENLLLYMAMKNQSICPYQKKIT